MLRKHWCSVVVLALAMLGTNASAQKYEIAGSVGRTFISDQGVLGANPADPNVHFGNGLTYEANFARHFFDVGLLSVTVEVPFVFTPTTKVHFNTGLTPRSFRSYFVTPAARVNLFPSTAFSPWISVGGGFGHFSENSTLEFGAPNPASTGTNSGVFQSGGGLDVRLVGPLKLRGEVRDFYSGVPQLNVNTGKSRQHNIFVGGGAVLSF